MTGWHELGICFTLCLQQLLNALILSYMQCRELVKSPTDHPMCESWANTRSCSHLNGDTRRKLNVSWSVVDSHSLSSMKTVGTDEVVAGIVVQKGTINVFSQRIYDRKNVRKRKNILSASCRILTRSTWHFPVKLSTQLNGAQDKALYSCSSFLSTMPPFLTPFFHLSRQELFYLLN